MVLACTAGVGALAGTLQGTATYRERLMLPPDAAFEAQLRDISRVDAPAAVIGRARLDPAGQPPFRFSIDFDDAAIGPRGRYAVRATVTHQRRHPPGSGRRQRAARVAAGLGSPQAAGGCGDGQPGQAAGFVRG